MHENNRSRNAFCFGKKVKLFVFFLDFVQFFTRFFSIARFKKNHRKILNAFFFAIGQVLEMYYLQLQLFLQLKLAILIAK